jgi:alpha-glucosidase
VARQPETLTGTAAKVAMSLHEGFWWQRGVVYQVYPRSFQDANGDGIGDLRGIIQRLDYLHWLGIDAMWLSPIYPSPMADFGYDISDFKAIDPIFGTLADFDELVQQSHRRGIKVILDFVPNHTSDRHPWFQEARRNRHDPRRDWYIWRDPAPGGGPPNNWLSEFGGSAWQYESVTRQYYYHAFLKEQPDLNWRNAALRSEMHDVLRFWLDRGVDGFRIDVIHHLLEDALFRDNPPNPGFEQGMRPSHALLRTYTVDQPELQDIIAEVRSVVDEYPEKVLIGEIHLPIDRLVTYYGAELSGIHLPFNFNLIGAPWSATVLRDLIATYEAALPSGAWPNWVLGNHDTARIASRIGSAGARLAAMLLLTLRGTPTMYYGDEIGMENAAIGAERVRDPFEKNVPGIGVGRDPARTPMHWQPAGKGGFTRGEPWLPLGDNVSTCNVNDEAADPGSMLSLYRRLLSLRRSSRALTLGNYNGVPAGERCLAYVRQHGEERMLVALNLSNDPYQCPLQAAQLKGKIVLSTNPCRAHHDVAGSVELDDAEGVVVALSRQ